MPSPVRILVIAMAALLTGACNLWESASQDDRTSPAIVDSSVASGSTDVPTDTTVHVVLSEPVDPNTVHDGNVTLHDGNDNVPVAVQPDGSTIRVTPQRPLKLGTTYQLSVGSGVKDPSGNPMETAHITFTTEDGEWAAPVTFEAVLAGVPEQLQVAGDTNGGAVAVWVQNNNGPATLWSARYSGGQWSWPAAVQDMGMGIPRVPVIASDAAGNVLIAWQEDAGAGTVIKARRQSVSGAWGPIHVLQANAQSVGTNPAVAMNPRGDGVVAWEDRIAAGRRNIYASVVTSAGAFGASTAVDNAATADGRLPSVAIDTGGKAWIGWTAPEGGRDTAYVTSAGVGGTWGARQTLPNAVGSSPGRLANSDQVRLAAGGTGQVLATWVVYHVLGGGPLEFQYSMVAWLPFQAADWSTFNTFDQSPAFNAISSKLHALSPAGKLLGLTARGDPVPVHYGNSIGQSCLPETCPPTTYYYPVPGDYFPWEAPPVNDPRYFVPTDPVAVQASRLRDVRAVGVDDSGNGIAVFDELDSAGNRVTSVWRYRPNKPWSFAGVPEGAVSGAGNVAVAVNANGSALLVWIAVGDGGARILRSRRFE